MPKIIKIKSLSTSSYHNEATNVKKRRKSNYYYGTKCFVPDCPSNSREFPNKIFLYGPSDPEMRQKWFEAVKRDDNYTYKTVIRCCEDHFDLENDVETRSKNKVRGNYLLLKKDVVPHIFGGQSNKNDFIEIFDEFGKTIAKVLKSLPLKTGILAMKQLEDFLFAQYNFSSCTPAVNRTILATPLTSTLQTSDLDPTKRKNNPCSIGTEVIHPKSSKKKDRRFISKSILNDHRYTYFVDPDIEPNSKANISIKKNKAINKQNQIKYEIITTEKVQFNNPNQLEDEMKTIKKEKVDEESDNSKSSLEKSMEYYQNQLKDEIFSKISIKEEKVDEQSNNFKCYSGKFIEYYDYSTDTASSCYDDCDKSQEMNVVCKIEAEEERIVKTEPEYPDYEDQSAQR